VIGAHTPEFAFEHDLDNVRRAITAMQVEYPIAVDNDYAIWNGFSNQYWPALYLIDAKSAVRFTHFGEGAYDESERAIQKVLGEAGASGFSRELVTVAARVLRQPPTGTTSALQRPISAPSRARASYATRRGCA